jgi:hypothetical protein
MNLQGHGWEEGEVRRQLAALIELHRDTPKQPAFVYSGPAVGECVAEARQPSLSMIMLARLI